jgi:hypothetical protein
MPLTIYLDSNILISIESGQYSIEHFENIFATKDLVFPYSQAHAFEWIAISDKQNIKAEHFLEQRFETVRKVCQNYYLYRDYKSKSDQHIIRDPRNAYGDASDSSVGLTAINLFANIISPDQIEQMRLQFELDPQTITNIHPSEAIKHLNTKLTAYNSEYSFAEVIEKAISYFPNPEDFSHYHRFAGYFAFLDALGYWKDRQTSNSNVARLWDSMHAYFASKCDYFVSDDKRARQKTRVVFDLYQIKIPVISGAGSLQD